MADKYEKLEKVANELVELTAEIDRSRAVSAEDLAGVIAHLLRLNATMAREIGDLHHRIELLEKKA